MLLQSRQGLGVYLACATLLLAARSRNDEASKARNKPLTHVSAPKRGSSSLA